MRQHLPLRSSELHEVSSAVAQCDAVVRAGWLVYPVNVLSVVFPETDWANQIIAALGKRDVITARALMPRGRIGWLIPNWSGPAHSVISANPF